MQPLWALETSFTWSSLSDSKHLYSSVYISEVITLRGLDQAVFSPQAHGHVGHIRWKPMGERWKAQNNSGPFVRLKNGKALGHSLQNINKLPVKQTVIIWHTNNQLMISIIWQIYFKPDSCVLKYTYFISEHIKKHFLKNRMVFQISTEWFISRLKKKKILYPFI